MQKQSLVFEGLYGADGTAVCSYQATRVIPVRGKRSLYSPKGPDRLRGPIPGRFTCICLCLFWRDSPQWARASFTRFLDHTQRRTIFGSSPLDE
jgi:hypothetical protein